MFCLYMKQYTHTHTHTYIYTYIHIYNYIYIYICTHRFRFLFYNAVIDNSLESLTQQTTDTSPSLRGFVYNYGEYRSDNICLQR